MQNRKIQQKIRDPLFVGILGLGVRRCRFVSGPFAALVFFSLKFRTFLIKKNNLKQQKIREFLRFLDTKFLEFLRKKTISRCFFSKKFRKFLLCKMAKFPGIFGKKNVPENCENFYFNSVFRSEIFAGFCFRRVSPKSSPNK